MAMGQRFSPWTWDSDASISDPSGIESRSLRLQFSP
jgi:hypothetical protein